LRLWLAPLLVLSSTAISQSTPPPQPAGTLPFSVSVFDRTRAEGWEWFNAPPSTNTYGYVESQVRLGIAQHIRHYDWQLEMLQPVLLDLPTKAVAPVTAQGQLGLGGTYYASNGNNDYPAAASLKQAYLRYHFTDAEKNIRIGRFEFFDGQETRPANTTLQWLQTNRIAQRLVGNFGFSNGLRSFDGIDAHVNGGFGNLAGMVGRADQGVYNMNGNPELNVDLQYLAYSGYELKQRLLFRVFGLGYHDGRTGITKTDNRPLAVRSADHRNIRLGTYGGNLLTALPAGPGQFDFLAWGVGQSGNWGALHHSAGAVAVEGGYKLTSVRTEPWLRGGFFRSTGDHNPTDGDHNTFFQVLPTPRVYARFPFFNLMNLSDQFAQFVDKPVKKVDVRTDLHFLQLTSSSDLTYTGGGAFDNKVFGFTGRPANGHASLATLADVSADYQVTSTLAVNVYYAHASGKTVISAIYPAGRNAQLGYAELVYRWNLPQRPEVTSDLK
jgi:hypothetical protein